MKEHRTKSNNMCWNNIEFFFEILCYLITSLPWKHYRKKAMDVAVIRKENERNRLNYV